MNTTFHAINNPDKTISLTVTIDNGDGSFTSMSKETYDATRTDTPTKAELDAIAKAEADAKAQADARAKAEAQAQAIKSSAVSKLAKLGLTDEEIAALVG